MTFDLSEFQEEVIHPSRNLLSSTEEKDFNTLRENASLIKTMYEQVRTKRRLNKVILSSLTSQNEVVKMAALDIISQFPEKRARNELFIALEEESNVLIRQKIVELIDQIEARVSKGTYSGQSQITLTSALRYVREANYA